MKARAKGQIIPLIALGWVFFMALAAGMFDMVYIYSGRAKLIAAVDAAAIAATRELVSGTTLAEQQATMDRIVNMIFRANFPDGYFMSTSSGFDPPVLDSPQPGMKRVSVNGHASFPTFFLGVFGKSELDIAASAIAVRRDSNIMLTLDKSGSMNYFSGAPWAALQTAVPLFVNEFSEQNDRIGAAFYSTNSFVDYSIQYSKGSQPFKQDIANIVSAKSPGGWTNIAGALYSSYSQLNVLADNSALNVIVLFSDGRLTALTNEFPVRTASGGGQPWCVAGGGELASPRWGTVAACPNIPGSPCGAGSPDGPYRIDLVADQAISNCFQSGGGAYTGSGTQAQNLVLEVPTTWQPLGSGHSFSIFHAFNPSLPASPIPLSSENIITTVGENLALNIAEQARQQGILIFTIGLGADVNPAFMRALANDPASALYDVNQPSGEYVFAADSAGLVDAFLRVASSVTHLTQ